MRRICKMERQRRDRLAPFKGRSVNNPMIDAHTIHKAEELIDKTSHFEVWPFTVDTGCPISDLNEPHLHDFYVIQYVVEGKGTHVIDFKPYDIIPDSLYFISPQQLHLWRPEGDIEGYVMAFTEDFLRAPDSPLASIYELDFFYSLTHSPVLNTNHDQAETLIDLMESIQREFNNKNEGYVSVLRAFFHILVVNLQRMFSDRIKAHQGAKEPSLAREFKRLVAHNYDSQMSIQEYADSIGVSVSRLNSVVKSATGLTPGQIVRNETVLAAKRLLAHSDMNVAEICFQLKFEDPSYFGRFFKRETGMTPSIFRETVQEKYHQLAR